MEEVTFESKSLWMPKENFLSETGQMNLVKNGKWGVPILNEEIRKYKKGEQKSQESGEEQSR